MATNLDEIALLRKKLAEMTDRVARLEQQSSASDREAVPAPAVETCHEGDAGPEHSRRALLKKAGIGVAAAAAAVGSTARPAAAANGDNMVLGSLNNRASSPTSFAGTANPPGNVFTYEDAFTFGSTSGYPSSLAAYCVGANAENGFFAYNNSRTNSDANTGHGIVVAVEGGGRSQLLLKSFGSLGDPTQTTYAHTRGEIVAQATGALWYCTADGTPGTWRKLSGPAVAGSMHAITPKRVWDSRFQGGAMTDREQRVVSVADGRALGSASVDVPDLVPEGATAVTFNLAILNTGASGYLSITPGDASAFTAASINWNDSNSILNNGTMSTIDANRQVKVWCSGTTDFVIDITGYYR